MAGFARASARLVRLAFARIVLVLVLVLVLGCGGDDDGDGRIEPSDAGDGCLAPLSLDCRPSFEPASYDDIFRNVLRPSCGSSASGTRCHGAEGMQGGLVLADADEGYRSLLGELDDRPRVVPGDPECSMLIERIESDNPGIRMPLNSAPLSEGIRCAIRQWIAEGAER